MTGGSPPDPRRPRPVEEQLAGSVEPLDPSAVDPQASPGGLSLLGPEDAADSQLFLRRALRSGDAQRVIATCWRLWRRELLERILAKGVPTDHADDVLQNVFALLARDYHRVRSDRLQGWLVTMVGYECRRFFQDRARARPRSAPMAAVPPPDFHGPGPELQLDRQRDLGVAFAFLEGLAPLDSFVLMASLHEGHSTARIAAEVVERFGVVISDDALRQRRSQLRRTLASHILQARRGCDVDGD